MTIFIVKHSRRPFRPNSRSRAKLLKQPLTIRLDAATVAYFKTLAEDADLPYQTLINLYLRDCAATERRLDLRWRKCKPGAAKQVDEADGRLRQPQPIHKALCGPNRAPGSAPTCSPALHCSRTAAYLTPGHHLPSTITLAVFVRTELIALLLLPAGLAAQGTVRPSPAVPAGYHFRANLHHPL